MKSEYSPGWNLQEPSTLSHSLYDFVHLLQICNTLSRCSPDESRMGGRECSPGRTPKVDSGFDGRILYDGNDWVPASERARAMGKGVGPRVKLFGSCTKFGGGFDNSRSPGPFRTGPGGSCTVFWGSAVTTSPASLLDSRVGLEWCL